MPLPQKRLGALFALMALLLFAGGELLRVAHFAVVRHTVCVAHGDWSHHDNHNQVTEALSSSESSAPRLVAGAETNDEHCSELATEPATFAALEAPRWLETSIDFLEPDGRERTATLAIDVLSVAPKLAPPC